MKEIEKALSNLKTELKYAKTNERDALTGVSARFEELNDLVSELASSVKKLVDDNGKTHNVIIIK